MTITEVRDLTAQRFSSSIIIEETCTRALRGQPEDVDRAELLLFLAEAIFSQPHRHNEAAQYAREAYELALRCKLFLIAVKSACLSISCLTATGLRKESVFWSDVTELSARMKDWIRQMEPSQLEVNQAMSQRYLLEQYGQRLAQNGGFAA